MKGWPGEPEMQHDVMVAQDEASESSGKPITDVIFDFGNVLVYWDPEAVLIPRYDQSIVDQFLDNEISGFYDANDQMDGGASLEEGYAFVKNKHGDYWADVMQYYLDNFVDSLTGVVPGARVLINDLRKAGIRVWGLSNWQQDLYHIAEDRFEILHDLDGKVISGNVKMRKPHKEIFEYALNAFGIDASGAVFIDDKAMNIVGANKAGIRGIRFADPRALREVLIEAGLPIPPVVR